MHHLVGMGEVTEMLGVTPQRVDQLIEAHRDFPKPVAVLKTGRVWSRKGIESWMLRHGRVPKS